MIRKTHGWSWKEISLIVGIIVTTIGGIRVSYSMWNSFKKEQQDASDRHAQYLVDKAIMQDRINDLESSHKEDRTIINQMLLRGCHR